jgi:acyl-CoA thioester hydrolase
MRCYIGRVSDSIPFDVPIGVDPADIDFMGHVNNASYLKWVQEAVVSHWQKLAPADAVATHLWVALKHEITYRKPTFLGDDVIATVLLEKVQGARAFYGTVIRRGEEVLAEVKSSWCCLDAETLKPARLAREVIDRFFQPPDQAKA